MNLTSRQDDALGLERQLGQLRRARQHLGVNIEATQTAQDQVAGLAAEVEHQDGLCFVWLARNGGEEGDLFVTVCIVCGVSHLPAFGMSSSVVACRRAGMSKSMQ